MEFIPHKHSIVENVGNLGLSPPRKQKEVIRPNSEIKNILKKRKEMQREDSRGSDRTINRIFKSLYKP